MRFGRYRLVLWLGSVTLVALSGTWGVSHYFPFANRSKPDSSGDANAPTREPKSQVLDQGQREFLWQVEHHGLVLSRSGFQALADALSRADRQGLVHLLAPSFEGQAPASEPAAVLTGLAEIQRLQNVSQPLVHLHGPEFIDRLLAFRRPFTRPPKVQLSLIQLAPEERHNLSGTWQGACQLRMSGEMGPGQPGEVVLQLHYQLPEPVEESLRQGGWLRSCSILRGQIAHAPHFLMREATAERGINAQRFHDNWSQPPDNRRPNTGGVYLCDFNRDGIVDLLITDLNGYVLYQGLPGGKFEDVTATMGLGGRPGQELISLMAAFVDLDGDGWEDLILGKRIYRNEGGKRFVDYTERTNLRLRPEAIGIAVADYDRDGLIDLYAYCPGSPKASSWLEGHSGQKPANQLWRNKGNWQFEEVSVRSGTTGGSRSTFSAVWLDANNDGWPDLYVINEFGNGVLLVNNGDGSFREKLLTDGPSDFGSMGVTCGDIDNDGNIDLYVANMYSKAGTRVIHNLQPGTYPEPVMKTMRQFVAGSQLWRNRGGLDFEPLGKEFGIASVGWAYGAALADLDNDGFLDLYATAGFMSQSRSDPDG